MDTEATNSSQKAHRKRQAGSKLDKKKKKAPADPNLTARQRNPKAFAYHSVNKVARQVRRLVYPFCRNCAMQILYLSSCFCMTSFLMALFKALFSPVHCLHSLLPPVKSNPYGLCSRDHNFLLPVCNNFSRKSFNICSLFRFK